MDHRWPTVVIAVPFSLFLQCLVACDTKSVAVVRPRRFVIEVPSLIGRGRAAVGRRDDTATVVGYDGLWRSRFEDDGGDVQHTDGRERRPDGDGCGNRREGNYNSATSQRPQPVPPATVIDQYDVLLELIVNINEQYEALTRKLDFSHDDQKTMQLTVSDSL